MRQYLWIAGLLVALVAAILLLVLPVQTALLPALVFLVLGMALFGLGVYLRQEKLRADIHDAMKRFAEARKMPFEDSLGTQGLPSSITLFQRGTKHRCSNVIGAEVHGHSGMLLQFEYWIPGRSRNPGHWQRRLAAVFPGAMKEQVDFELDPEGMLEKVTLLFSGQDIDFTGTEAAERFSARYQLRGPDEEKIRKFFDEERFAFFANHGGLCVESHQGDLALWYERGFKDQWQAEWDHSLRSVDDWLPEELEGLLEGARRLLERSS